MKASAGTKVFIIMLLIVLIALGWLYYQIVWDNKSSFQNTEITINLDSLVHGAILSANVDENVEWILCLGGYQEGNNLYIDTYYTPDNIGTPDTLQFVECPDFVFGMRLVGTIHNHPGISSSTCWLSAVDYAHEIENLNTNAYVSGVVCENEVSWWVTGKAVNLAIN